MEPFEVHYRSGSLTFVFQVELLEAGKQLEKFRLMGGDKVVVLQSNRPLLLARGLKRKAVHWKVLEGKINNIRALEDVTKLIERKLKGEDITPKQRNWTPKSPFQTKSKPDWKNKTGEGPTLRERNNSLKSDLE